MPALAPAVWRNPYAPSPSSPLLHPEQRCYVIVTIERDGEYVGLKRWSSRRGFAAIRRAAKAAYPGCQLQFGRCWWMTP
jgi:hypothetical protein